MKALEPADAHGVVVRMTTRISKSIISVPRLRFFRLSIEVREGLRIHLWIRLNGGPQEVIITSVRGPVEGLGWRGHGSEGHCGLREARWRCWRRTWHGLRESKRVRNSTTCRCCLLSRRCRCGRRAWRCMHLVLAPNLGCEWRSRRRHTLVRSWLSCRRSWRCSSRGLRGSRGCRCGGSAWRCLRLWQRLRDEASEPLLGRFPGLRLLRSGSVGPASFDRGLRMRGFVVARCVHDSRGPDEDPAGCVWGHWIVSWSHRGT